MTWPTSAAPFKIFEESDGFAPDNPTCVKF